MTRTWEWKGSCCCCVRTSGEGECRQGEGGVVGDIHRVKTGRRRVSSQICQHDIALPRRSGSRQGSSSPDEDGSYFDGGETLIDIAAFHDAAWITDWPSVSAISQSHPESAQKYVGKEGWNALQHVCDRRCPNVDVVVSLLMR